MIHMPSFDARATVHPHRSALNPFWYVFSDVRGFGRKDLLMTTQR